MDALIRFLTRPVGLLVVLGVGLTIVRAFARHYEAAQLRRGDWDEHGPSDPSEPPPRTRRSYGMQERLEVIGLWRGKRTDREPPTNDRPSV